MADAECFVIMPFGQKEDASGQSIDFDTIYQYLIKSTLEHLDIKCTRCDEIDEAGWIHSKMFQYIYQSRVAVVDITALNPNVFYELGVRHTLADRVTVILKRKGTKVPFNIQDFKVIEYDETHPGSVEKTKKKIGDFIQNGLKLRKTDSPVHEVLKLRINPEPVKLDMLRTFEYSLKGVPGKSICLVTGDLQNIKHMADIWVSSENTNMQMSRHFERSVSGVIRFYGAKKNRAGRIVEDTIAKELAEVVGENAYVDPATIVATGPGKLGETHGVKQIFHAAAVVGEVGVGYTPIGGIDRCISNALQEADKDEYAPLQLRSILFPLIGTGTGRGSLEKTAPSLIKAAIAYLNANRNSRVEKVYFVAWSDKELDVCQTALQEAPEVAIV
jgi:O-acetyl-ADP-ribose deacetylase (regulator of RNase III)